MKILLDTHIILWLATGSNKLFVKATGVVKSNADIFISVASIWELVIKSNLGKLNISTSIESFISNFQENFICDLLTISPDHLYKLQWLPFHHQDPFDRLLISQAQTEDFILLTKDKTIGEYQAKTIW